VSQTILIMAGGTGGHVFPGLAVAEEMRGRGWNVVWMGARAGLEARLVPARGYPVEWIHAAALRGKGLAAKLLLPLRLLAGFWQSARAILRVRPAVVLSMGGYVAFPGGMMASLLARPLAVHEQNAIAGLANRVLAGVADKTMVAFPGALARSEWTGNPVRADIAGVAEPAARYGARSGPLRLLVVGGSLGAQALNEVVPQALGLIAESERPLVTHQSGDKNLESLRLNYSSAKVEGTLVSFVEDMARAYAEADLVICRAGAMTVAELSAAGMASVLVPFPHAVDDHQTANARFLSEQGAAILLPQAELSPEKLCALLRSLDRAKLLEMAGKARALGKPEATRIVADRCVALAAVKTSGGAA
jgi:UDP-N-acetylglucosamine--N-acetylmuramyl-(pentapeptide) pyrophosphoryl-undecaprenol N-acetylglucosamine transferase